MPATLPAPPLGQSRSQIAENSSLSSSSLPADRFDLQAMRELANGTLIIPSLGAAEINEENLITTPEAARLLRISRHSVWELLREGVLLGRRKTHRPGSDWLVCGDSVELYRAGL